MSAKGISRSITVSFKIQDCSRRIVTDVYVQAQSLSPTSSSMMMKMMMMMMMMIHHLPYFLRYRFQDDDDDEFGFTFTFLHVAHHIAIACRYGSSPSGDAARLSDATTYRCSLRWKGSDDF